MSGIQYIPNEYALSRTGNSASLISSGSFSFATTDNKTTEKTLTISSVGTMKFHPESYFLLAISNPADNSSGSSFGLLTVKTYNVVNIAGMPSNNFLHTTHSVGSSSATTYTDFLVQGLFTTGDVVLGSSFGTNITGLASAIDYALFRL